MQANRYSVPLNPWQYWGLIILRMIVGWHFLYEGIVKIMDPQWSAELFLVNSRGFLSGLFHWMAHRPEVLEAVNAINVWGLILIGLGLFLGVFARLAVYAGILLLLLYYLAYPPLRGLNFGVPQEGHYLLINKNFVELAVLVLLSLFPRTLNNGLGNLLKEVRFRLPWSSQKPVGKAVAASNAGNVNGGRREMLKDLAFLPLIGGFSLAFLTNKKYIPSRAEVDVITGGTITLDHTSIRELEEQVPKGKLGDREVSRLIIGGNLIAGGAHSRGLKYANTLFKAYNTEKKVFETLILAEKAGINTMNVNCGHLPLIYRYRKLFGSKIQIMVQVGTAGARDHSEKNICQDIDRSMDLGMDFIQIWGASGDYLARNGQTAVMGRCLEYAMKKGLPVGIGAHEIHAYYIYKEAGLPEPDFYFKTMHHDNYRYVRPESEREPFRLDGNMWDLFPSKTVDFMKRSRKPFVAYKVLAAGAIPPESGFQYAFDNGADFICVGMFDFQIVEDANIAARCFRKAHNRSREWCG